MKTPGIKAGSKLSGVPGGESTYISTSAEGGVKLSEWTGVASNQLIDKA